MSRTVEELQGSAPLYGGEKKTINRRSFIILGGIGLTAAGALGIGTKLALGGGNETAPEESVSANYNAPAPEGDANVNSLIVPKMPDFYEERPWANPEYLFDLTSKERRATTTIPINEYTRTNEGFTETVRQIFERMANVARTERDVLKAIELGYPVGKLDSDGRMLGGLGEYGKTYYLDDMVSGFISDDYGPEVSTNMKDYLATWTNDYERSLTDPRWIDYASIMVDAEYLGLESGSKVIGLTLGRSAPEGQDWREAKTVHTGKIVVDTSERTDGIYNLATRHFSLNPKV